jgi:hypothetical protein
MKASACGLETFIKDLTNKEIVSLIHNPINGSLKFREVSSDKFREIPFELKYNKNQKDLVKVDLIPKNVYFGEVDKIIFSINRDYYHELIDCGTAEGARFFSRVGKLYLYSKNHKDLF